MGGSLVLASAPPKEQGIQNKMPEYFVRDLDPPWSQCGTLEEWIRKALKQGLDAEVAALVKLLPEEKKEKYRKIWKEVKGQK